MITTVDVFAIVVDSPKRVLLGHFAVTDTNLRMYYLPAGSALECGSSSLSGRAEIFFSSLSIW
jgi:hypothetical protein